MSEQHICDFCEDEPAQYKPFDYVRGRGFHARRKQVLGHVVCKNCLDFVREQYAVDGFVRLRADA